MTSRYRVVAAALAGVSLLLFARLPQATSRHFAPDVVFTGSSLAGWRTLGGATWDARDGEIVARPRGGPGWLVLDRAYQDVAFYASFRCEPGCEAGVLLRAEPLPDGGHKGIFVSLTEGDLGSYQVTLDPGGRIATRERLRPAGGGQLRVAPPPPAPDAAGRGGRGGPGAGRGAGPGGALAAPQLPGGIPVPIARPDTSLRPGDWNTVDIILDANILRPSLNDGMTGLTGGVADPEHGSHGPLALYAGGTGEVRFRDVSYKDLQPRVADPEHVSPRFRLQRLNEFYYSWGADVADFNRDGVPDIVAGPYYYLGPDYTEAREIFLAQTLNPSTQYFNGVQFAHDFTGDGWPDVVNALFTQPLVLYVNPAGESRRWEMRVIDERVTSELALLKDIDGDGRPDLIYKDGNNQFVYANPDPANPAGPWIKRAISEPGPWANHGMGVGDINGNGRLDFVNAYGWWEQPAANGEGGTWTYHPAAFGRWTRSSPGGAEIAVYDVNGNGLNDIVTSLQAHGWGLSWFEQVRGADGRISFREHEIMGDFSTKNAGGVTFSQLHGSGVGDIDGDGIPDFVTGKRFWSHLDTYLDPDPHGAPVLYVYRTVRNPRAPGGAEFVPELVHNRSGIGSEAVVYDLNGNGALDIVTSTRRGTFIFWNGWREGGGR